MNEYFGIAWSWSPRNWRLGWYDALTDDGRKIGDWLFFGPVALCWEWD